MKDKQKAVTWLCLTVIVTAGLRYVPPYLLEQRRLDQQDRALDFKERVFLKEHGTVAPPTVALPENAPIAFSPRRQTL